jgi:hypothetical protein
MDLKELSSVYTPQRVLSISPRTAVGSIIKFGLRICPVAFMAMMQDLQELWMLMARSEAINISNHNE